MREVGNLAGISKNLNGNLILSVEVEDTPALIEEYERLKEGKVVVEVKKYKDKRSLDANAYFWQLCDKISRVLGSDKDTVYLMMLKDAGVFTDVKIKYDAVEQLKMVYRLCEIRETYTEETGFYEEYETWCIVRCYYGSHLYDTVEMSHLINHTVNQAQELGIDTITPDEQAHMLSLWGENWGKKKLKTE